MKKSKICILTLVLSLLWSSCGLTVSVPLYIPPSQTKLARQEFIEKFQETNLEREKAGLAPLDLCTEKYNFDRGWALEDPNCKKRIKAYEAGDKNALGTPQLGKNEEKQEKQ